MDDVKRSSTSWNTKAISQFKMLFWSESDVSSKKQINWRSIKLIAIAVVVVFVVLVLLLPTEQERSFSEKSESPNPNNAVESRGQQARSSAEKLWESPRSSGVSGSTNTQSNYDTPMVLGSELGNARTQLRSGQRISIRFLERFVVSDSSVPVMAEVISDATTDSGLKIPSGSKLYGEAVFQRGQTRAEVNFSRMSYPNGQISPIAMTAASGDGQLGIAGNVKSDATKNAVGSVLTTFVAGLASGSVETDPFGGSRGGITNGILTAVGNTARDRASAFGEKLKAEREWMEVSRGFECEAVLREVLDFQRPGDRR